VAVAQLVEPRVVVPVVAGSSPVRHLTPAESFAFGFDFLRIAADGRRARAGQEEPGPRRACPGARYLSSLGWRALGLVELFKEGCRRGC
jgi:hypothetical protein